MHRLPNAAGLSLRAVKHAVEAARVGGLNLLFGSSLASLSLAARPRAMIQYLADSLFLHRAMCGRRGLPQRNVVDVLAGSQTQAIRLGSLGTGAEWFWPQASYTQDIVSLCLICQILRPRRVFEIGTLWGYTSYHFALNTPPDAQIFTLDLPRDGTAAARLPLSLVDGAHIRERSPDDRYRFDGTDEARKIRCLTGDSATFDFSPFHGTIDFFFVDGAHSYEYARSDTQHAVKCCRPGSVIAWHDYGKASLPGLTRFLDERAREWPLYSIPGGSVAFLVVP